MYTVYLVETVQTIIITHDAFNAYVRSFGDLAALALIQNEWLAIPVFSAFGAFVLSSSLMRSFIMCCSAVGGAVRMYYAYRLKLLSGSIVLSTVITIVRPRPLN